MSRSLRPKCALKHKNAAKCARVRPNVPKCAQVCPIAPKCAQVCPIVPKCNRVRPSAPKCVRVRLQAVGECKASMHFLSIFRLLRRILPLCSFIKRVDAVLGCDQPSGISKLLEFFSIHVRCPQLAQVQKGPTLALFKGLFFKNMIGQYRETWAVLR